MPTILYSEPETNFRYSLVLTEAEASAITRANPHVAHRLLLPATGGTIDFDGMGGAALTSPKFKHSFADATELIECARRSMIATEDQ